MSIPKVGIVVPAYNAERYIAECLRSAISQDYPNTHIYVVDDASTDCTREVIATFAGARPDRITWSGRSVNKGAGATRQEAIDMAIRDQCEYIAPLDADDLRDPDSVSKQVVLLERVRDAGLCYGRFNIVHWNGEPYTGLCWEKLLAWAKGMPEGTVWSHLIAYGTLGLPSAILIRTDAARMCRYDPDFRYFEDLDYWAQIATLPAFSRIIACDGVVYTYRFHACQALDRISAHELLSLRYKTMQTIGLRVFSRLEEQGRAIARNRRRRLWRMLVVRTMINAIRQREWVKLVGLGRDFARPIARLEAQLRDSKRDGRLKDILGMWASVS